MSHGAQLDDEEEEAELLNQQGCAAVYFQLEECLAEHDRDWRRCQEQVEALRRCYEAWRARQQEQEEARAARQPDDTSSQ